MEKTYIEIVHCNPPIPARHKRVRAQKNVTAQIMRIFAKFVLGDKSNGWQAFGKCSVNWYMGGAEVRIYHDTPGQSVSFWAIRHVTAEGKSIIPNP